MDNIKWLKRKYPNSFNELNEYFDRLELKNFKKSSLKMGRLTKSITWGEKYKKGTLIQFRRSNPVTDWNHPFVYCVTKCKIGYTASGYHSFNITENDFTEITS